MPFKAVASIWGMPACFSAVSKKPDTPVVGEANEFREPFLPEFALHAPPVRSGAEC